MTRQVVGQGRPVFTPETFAELKQRLWLPKFDRYVSIEDRGRLLHEADTAALWFDVPPQIAAQTFCRDADDDKFIHAALESNADWLVTGDKDLLVLAQNLVVSGIRIISPADAMQLLEFRLRT